MLDCTSEEVPQKLFELQRAITSTLARELLYAAKRDTG